MSRTFDRRWARGCFSARSFCVALFAFVLCCAGRAYAATIAILRPAGSSVELGEALFRLQGELLALGLEVRIAERAKRAGASALDAQAWFEQTAAAHDVDAVIDVIGDTVPTAVEVWIQERDTRRYRMTRVVLEPDAENAAETLAIRAIEVLRSSFLEIDLSARSRRSALVTPNARDEPAPAPQRAEQRFGLEAGAALLTSLDGVGPALLPLARVDGALGSSLTVELTLAGFGTRPSLEEESRSARVAQQFGVVGLCYCSPSHAGFLPILGLAAGALRTSVSGRADAPDRGHSIERWSVLVDAKFGARLGLPGGYHLTLASHLHWAEPYVAVHFVDTEVASTGRPNLLLSLTAGARL